jgi:hypothetical protein
LGIAAVGLLALECRAEVVRFKMTGTIDVSDPAALLPPDAYSGAPFVALLSYDTNMPDAESSPYAGLYSSLNGAIDFSLAVGSVLIRDDPSAEFTIKIGDDYRIISQNPSTDFQYDEFAMYGLVFGWPGDDLTNLNAFWINDGGNAFGPG